MEGFEPAGEGTVCRKAGQHAAKEVYILPEKLPGKRAAGGAAEPADLLHAGAGPHGATSERQGLCLTGSSPNGPGLSAPSGPLEPSKL